MQSEHSANHYFDLLVIGGGSGGVATARRAAEYGAKVGLIEGKALGGTCVNVGCVPKKLMFYAAQINDRIEMAPDYGFTQIESQLDFTSLKRSRDAYIDKLNGIYERNLEKAGVTYIKGWAQFKDDRTVMVGDDQYSGNRILIATGGKPARLDIPGSELGIDSDGFFELDTLPREVLIIGAGYIGVEIAGVLQGLGSKVTLSYRADKALRGFDEDIRDHLNERMIEQGIQLLPHHSPTRLEKSNTNRTTVYWDNNESTETDLVIWTTGRQPNLDGLHLDKAGVTLNQRGQIDVNDEQQTNVDHIYALGDIIGKIELTPVAIATGRKLAARLYNQATIKQDFDNVPTVVFSHPPIGTIGLSESDAIAQYGKDAIKVYRSRFNPMVFAFSEHKVPTLMKLICAGDDEKVVGLHICGIDADEMLQGFGVAIKMGATKADLDDCVAIHPTSAEEIVTMR